MEILSWKTIKKKLICTCGLNFSFLSSDFKANINLYINFLKNLFSTLRNLEIKGGLKLFSETPTDHIQSARKTHRSIFTVEPVSHLC